MPLPSFISLAGIVKTFQVKNQLVKVLHGIDLTIEQGDFAIIFGPSGCGKSTMLHVLLGLEEPTTGSTHFQGINLYSYTEDQRSEFRKQNICMIYQQPNWIKSLTVIENVAFALSLLGVAKNQALARALEMLKLVGLAEWAEYYPTELSSGQQQKVSLARALITDPKVIVADEPTGNLDYQSGVELMELLKKLNDQGTTVILVTHNIDNISYAKHIIQMFNGQIVNILDTRKQPLATIKKILLNTEKPTNIPPQVVVNDVAAQQPKKSPRRWHVASPLKLLKRLPQVLKQMSTVIRFVVLLVLYLSQKLLDKFVRKVKLVKLIPAQSIQHLSKGYRRTLEILDSGERTSISQVDLIDLSLKNMLAKRTRTLITVGGMTIGITTIVFLISIGFGLEKLVISRVARLEEMKQINAVPAVATNVRLDDQAVANFNNIPGVTKVLPVVNVVGKVSYQNSDTDVAVYGVMSDFLEESAIKPSQGSLFSEEQVSQVAPPSQVAGVTDDTVGEYGSTRGQVEVTAPATTFFRVRTAPSTSAAVIGYTSFDAPVLADEVWGSTYRGTEAGALGSDAEGKPLGVWLRHDVKIWNEVTSPTGEITYLPQLDDSGQQQIMTGYFAQLNMEVARSQTSSQLAGQVLGESDGNRFVDIASIDGPATPSAQEIKTVSLTSDASRQAVVNKALLRVLGIDENGGVGEKFTVSFIATEELLSNDQKVQSSPIEFTIVGVTSYNKTPVMYVPLKDIRQLGIAAYSQAKVVLESPATLPETRKQIELQGFKTTSVVDTVSQIENLFGSLRILLGILGVVALAVAALGMLNTLTVSLLERTREVGMMKAIGMKSHEVESLYLTESMIMGFMGGVGGLICGFLAGKLASGVLSAFALTMGYGVLDITMIPTSFVILILAISIVVGLVTGIYPARRATKISALNALRYE